jgi:AcrR family transcriptional regulator
VYIGGVPKLWTDTIAAHRDAVRDAALDATGALVAAHGLTAVTMSRIAQDSGIGRATLYKYFPDLESVLSAWHERWVRAHLARLAEVRDGTTGSYERLRAVLSAYCAIRRHGPGDELTDALHRDQRMDRAHAELNDFVVALIVEAVADGRVRADVPAPELASFCLHALAAAAAATSRAAVDRLVGLTLTGLAPPG